MIYHVPVTPALPTGEGLGWVPPPPPPPLQPLMKFGGRGSPWDEQVLLHLLPLCTYREIAQGISLTPLPCLVLLRVRPRQLLLVPRTGLCGKRLANIDSSLCTEGDQKEKKGRWGLSKKKERGGGVIGARCFHEWFYAILSSLYSLEK